MGSLLPPRRKDWTKGRAQVGLAIRNAEGTYLEMVAPKASALEQRIATALFQAMCGVRMCRVCLCTEQDCSGCVERTGHPCSWVAEDLCSACDPGCRIVPAAGTAPPRPRRKR